MGCLRRSEFAKTCLLSSSEGSIWCSHRTAVFSYFKSTQMRTVPGFLMTGTIAAHQSVGSVTGQVTPDSTEFCFNSIHQRERYKSRSC